MTTEHVPYKIHPIPYKISEVMETDIQEVHDLRITEPSVPPYSSSVVLVPRKDGSVQFCFPETE